MTHGDIPTLDDLPKCQCAYIRFSTGTYHTRDGHLAHVTAVNEGCTYPLEGNVDNKEEHWTDRGFALWGGRPYDLKAPEMKVLLKDGKATLTT